MHAVIAGAGITPFVRRSDRTLVELGRQAVLAAIRDAGIDHRVVGAAFVGAGYGSAGLGQRVLKDLGMTGIPVTNLENACASGAEAVHHAVRAVTSGSADVALALGLDAPSRALGDGLIPLDPAETMMTQLGMTFPALYALRAQQYLREYDATVAQLAAVSVKNRRHGSANEIAALRTSTDLDEVLAAPMIAEPLTRLMACPSADGAAAVIVARSARHPGRATVAATALGSGELIDTAGSADTLSRRTADRAYDAAGLGPADIDLAEVHDAFTIGELNAIEALGLTPAGEAGAYVESGNATIGGGGVAVNPSGGLLARGHPMGATGVAQVVEAVLQLERRAGARQVDGARVALCHTRGGGIFDIEANACAVTILTG